jgi:glyoxylase-like metal-dependent hydrolase (beta-lactamase superfamily II)
MSTAQYEVLAIRYGTLVSTKSHLFYRYSSYGESDEEQRMDFFFWVVRNRDNVVVVDTGFSAESGARRKRTMLCEPAAALARIGVDPDTVETVVVTHGHYDHTGNLGLFPKSRIMIAEEELAFWGSPIARRRQFDEHAERSDLDFIVRAQDKGAVTVVRGSAELMPGLWVTTVGGHCPGQMVVTVDCSEGPVILASDAVHLYEEIELDRPFSVISNLPAMYATFDLLRRNVAEDRAVVVPGHDPLVTSRFPALGGCEGLAYRLS